MTASRTVTVVCSSVLVLSMGSSVLLTRHIDTLREGAALREVLWIPSAKTVERMSLGYKGLIANIYWTRVVQYFGSKHYAHSMEYKLLKPLLEITTTLDPKLLPAYEFGGIFLAQQPPEGAGDPNAAAELVEKGIRNNPHAWRLRYDLGFIYWLELNDPRKAADVFLEGSKVPGAHQWMVTMAAALAQQGGEREKSRYLWSNIASSTEDEHMKRNAMNRLQALDIDQFVDTLQERVDKYKELTGNSPKDFRQMVAEGWLRRIPVSPRGIPLDILNGHVELSDYKEYPFITRGKPAGY